MRHYLVLFLFCEENKFMKKKFIENKHVIYFNSLENLKYKLNFSKNQNQAYKIATREFAF